MAGRDGGLLPVLVFGPPGAGVELAVGRLVEAGFAAEAWDGTEPNPKAQDPELLGHWPLLLHLEAGPLACVARSGPPWASVPGPSDCGDVIARWELSRRRQTQARLRARLVIDTTHLNPERLRGRLAQLPLAQLLEPEARPLVVLESFGFPIGLPLDHSWCVDTRALQNPYWEPALRLHSGLDPSVREFVLRQELAQTLMAGVEEMVLAQLPAWTTSGRLVVRVAIGCTGGFHRSVAVAEELHRRLTGAGVRSLVWHRDLGRDG